MSRVQAFRRSLAMVECGYQALDGPKGNPWTARQHRAWLAILVGVGFALRLVFVMSNYRVPIGPLADESGYLVVAREFSDWWVNGNAVRGPLYPAFLALLGSNAPLVQVIQICLELVGLIIVFTLVTRRWGQLAAVIAGALWALYPPFIYHTLSFTPDSLFLLIFTALSAVLVVLWRKEAKHPLLWFAGLGCLFGLAELTRPLAVWPMVLAVIPVVWRHKPAGLRIRVAGTFFLAFLIVSSPWIIRNTLIYGQPLSSTVGSYGTLVGVPPKELVISPGGQWVYLAPLGYEYPFAGDIDNSKRSTFWRRDDLERSRFDRGLLWRFLQEEAWTYRRAIVTQHAKRPFQLWFNSSLGPTEIAGYKYLRGDRFAGLFHAGAIALVALGLIGVVVLRDLRRSTLPWILIACIATTIVLLMVLPQARYALPYVPFFIVWAGVLLASCGVALRLRSRTQTE